MHVNLLDAHLDAPADLLELDGVGVAQARWEGKGWVQLAPIPEHTQTQTKHSCSKMLMLRVLGWSVELVLVENLLVLILNVLMREV